MTIDWTEDEARSAEAGAETDQRCARVMGWTTEAGTPIREGDDVAPSQRVSRTAEGAHRAREWLREQGYNISFDTGCGIGVMPQTVMTASHVGGRQDQKFYARTDMAKPVNEHLATARLVLVLAANGVLDDQGGSQ